MAGIIRFIERLNKGINTTMVTLAAVAILALVGVCMWFLSGLKETSLSIGTDESIDATPTMIDKMHEIGQWEFLSLSDEELIDTVRKGFFSDDELARIYYGTLRLGIDFSNCDKGWIENGEDTIVITLPEITLLDNNFIDEARTNSFFESGKWSNEDRKAMYERARKRMIQRCFTKENKEKASKNASEQIRQMFIPIAKPKGVRVEFRRQ